MNTLFTSLYHLKLHTPASVCWFLFIPTILTFLITWWIGFTYLCNRSNDNVIYLLEREAKTLNWFSQLYTHTHIWRWNIFLFPKSIYLTVLLFRFRSVLMSASTKTRCARALVRTRWI